MTKPGAHWEILISNVEPPRPLRILIPTPPGTVGALYTQTSENIFLVEIYTHQNIISIFYHIFKNNQVDQLVIFPMLLQELGIVYQIFWHNSYSHDLLLPTDILILPGCDVGEGGVSCGNGKDSRNVGLKYLWRYTVTGNSISSHPSGGNTTQMCNSVTATNSQHFLLLSTLSSLRMISRVAFSQQSDGIEQSDPL